MPEPLSRRAVLLTHNAGLWEGTFLRLDAQGVEVERFASRLTVQEQPDPDSQGGGQAVQGQTPTIVASLRDQASGSVREMRFREPPPEMQIAATGHWSLGPDRIGPWPWVSELCLVCGDRRRRVVVRHGSDGIEAVVLVTEGRPGCADLAPPPIHRARRRSCSDQPGQELWLLEDTSSNRVEVQVMGRREFGTPQSVRLCWQPAGQPTLEIRRSHAASGLLEPAIP